MNPAAWLQQTFSNASLQPKQYLMCEGLCLPVTGAWEIKKAIYVLIKIQQKQQLRRKNHPIRSEYQKTVICKKRLCPIPSCCTSNQEHKLPRKKNYRRSRTSSKGCLCKTDNTQIKSCAKKGHAPKRGEQSGFPLLLPKASIIYTSD